MLKFTTILLCLATVSTVRSHHGDDKADYKQVNGDLTIKMLQTLTDDDNALFSPILLTNSLLMLTNAASGESRTELLKALNIKSEDDLSHINMDAKHIFDIREHLIEPKSKSEQNIIGKTEIDLLPRLMIRTDKELKEPFKSIAKDNYPIDIYKMPELNDESKKVETKKINDWFMSKSSTGLMNRMLDDNDLTSDVKMLLINGATFKGAWKGKLFDSVSTKESEFKNHDGKMSMIDFMNKENAMLKVNEYDDDKTMYIEVPFTEHDDGHGHKHGTKLVLLISKTDDHSLDSVMEEMTEKKLNERLMKVLSSPMKKIAKFMLPKLNFEKEYELKETLKELGAKQMFENGANFTRILEGVDLSKPDMPLNEIEHKAIVQWTEEADDSAMPAEASGDVPEILINKPFMFFILDDPNNGMAAKKMSKRHADHDHSHKDHKHDEDQHNDAMIVFAGRVKTYSKDLTFAKKQE